MSITSIITQASFRKSSKRHDLEQQLERIRTQPYPTKLEILAAANNLFDELHETPIWQLIKTLRIAGKQGLIPQIPDYAVQTAFNSNVQLASYLASWKTLVKKTYRLIDKSQRKFSRARSLKQDLLALYQEFLEAETNDRFHEFQSVIVETVTNVYARFYGEVK